MIAGETLLLHAPSAEFVRAILAGIRGSQHDKEVSTVLLAKLGDLIQKGDRQVKQVRSFWVFFSQLRICRPTLISFDPVFMDDGECAEYNENCL